MKFNYNWILLFCFLFGHKSFSQIVFTPKIGISCTFHEKIDERSGYYLDNNQIAISPVLGLGLNYNLNSKMDIDYSLYYTKNNVDINSSGIIPYEKFNYNLIQNTIIINYNYKLFSFGIGGSLNSQFNQALKPTQSTEFNSILDRNLSYGFIAQFGLLINNFRTSIIYNNCFGIIDKDNIKIHKSLEIINLIVGYQFKLKFKGRKSIQCPHL